MNANDTIVAISTAQGEGGIGIVRLSGPDAIALADRIWRGRKGARLADTEGWKLAYGRIVVDNREIDEAVVSVMRAPKSYTREDVVEFNCHGGPLPLRETLLALIKEGARLADPGEFTKRAFLNGRVDLTQAEAVIDTIRARTERAARLAVRQLEGGLSAEITSISGGLKEILAGLEAAVDFSDEDIEPPSPESLKKDIDSMAESIEKLLATAGEGEIIRSGIRLAIVGRPNVGKSSLLNALLKRERAIVTPVPGTTRDIIEESINISGVPFIVVDTAGIRDGADAIEEMGVALSRRSLAEADLVLVVIDITGGLTPDSRAILETAKNKPCVIAINKVDLSLTSVSLKLEKTLTARNRKAVSVSALRGTGLDELKDACVAAVFAEGISSENEILISNARHTAALQKALTSVRRSSDSLARGLSEEFASAEIRDALSALGEITGETVGADILEKIFSEFCIGK